MEIGKLGTKEEMTAVFDFSEEVKITLRYVPSKQILRRWERTGATSVKIKKGVAVDKIDNIKAARDLGEMAVVDWEGFTQEGKEFPFTDENRDTLMTEFQEFSDFVHDNCDVLEKFAVEQGNKEIKKSKSTPVGG